MRSGRPFDTVASQQGKSFQEAFKDLLKNTTDVGLKAALKESVGARGKARHNKS
jgi:hypothetical protein